MKGIQSKPNPEIQKMKGIQSKPNPETIKMTDIKTKPNPETLQMTGIPSTPSPETLKMADGQPDPNQETPKIADIQPIKQKEGIFAFTKPTIKQKYYIILGVGMFLSLCSLTILGLGTALEEGYVTSICFLPSASFMLEFTTLVRFHWGILEIDDNVRKLAEVAYVIFGLLFIFYGVLFFAPILFELYFNLIAVELHATFLWTGCALIFVQGIGYLVLGILGWKKHISNQVTEDGGQIPHGQVLQKPGGGAVLQKPGEGQEVPKSGKKKVLQEPGEGQVLPKSGKKKVLQEPGEGQVLPKPEMVLQTVPVPAPVRR